MPTAPKRRRWLIPVVVSLAVLLLLGAGFAAYSLAHAAAKPKTGLAGASPRPTPMSPQEACRRLIPALEEQVKDVMAYANGDHIDADHLSGSLDLVHEVQAASPVAIATDVDAVSKFVNAVLEQVRGGSRDPIDTDGFRASGTAIVVYCAPYGPTPQAEPEVTTQAPRPAPGTIEGDGTFLVPSEVKAGTYRTTVPEGGHCYWERLRGTSGTLSDVIANDNSDPGARVIVTIKASDKAFHTEGCGDWAKVK
jgi:hypothetical protein